MGLERSEGRAVYHASGGIAPVPPLTKFVLVAAPSTRTSEATGALEFYDSRAASRFEVPKRVGGKWGRNFKSAALAHSALHILTLNSNRSRSRRRAALP